MKEIYRRERKLTVCGVGVCPATREDFVREAFSMPTTPVSAAIVLVGVPGVISARENPQVAAVYERASFAAIDGMPLVKIARKKGFRAERCAADRKSVV